VISAFSVVVIASAWQFPQAPNPTSPNRTGPVILSFKVNKKIDYSCR
jgi:hypothetical protein